MQFFVDGESGQRILDMPAEVKGGEKISFGYSDVSKEFNLGDEIQFTAEEFVELATTCLLFSFQIQKSIRALQQSKVKPK